MRSMVATALLMEVMIRARMESILAHPLVGGKAPRIAVEKSRYYIAE